MGFFRAFLSVALVQASAVLFAAEPFELHDGDRVILLGGTFIERDVNYGFVETVLTSAWPDRKIVFRNLGWSGDTVWAESRGIFDPPAEGYKRMLDLVRELKPTVIFLAYGANESFSGEAGLEPFAKQYEKLCDDLQPTKARLVFVTPPPFERPNPPLPDSSRHNANLEEFCTVVRSLAARRQARLVDLFAQVRLAIEQKTIAAPLTEDGVTPNPRGFASVAQVVANDLQLPNRAPRDEWFASLQQRASWRSTKPPSATPTDQLRRLIVEKNTLFFHRWRPQNITYLTGFRKHEQGNNAVEIAQFDPLVAEAETQITELLRTTFSLPN